MLNYSEAKARRERKILEMHFQNAKENFAKCWRCFKQFVLWIKGSSLTENAIHETRKIKIRWIFQYLSEHTMNEWFLAITSYSLLKVQFLTLHKSPIKVHFAFVCHYI